MVGEVTIYKVQEKPIGSMERTDERRVGGMVC